MRLEPGHDQVRRQIKNHIADVEQGQTCGDLLRGDIQHGAQVMPDLCVHRLRQTDIGSHRRAEKVEDPEGWEDPSVEFSA